MIKGLFINNVKAQDSIYESGLMVYNCLKLSDKYTLDYIEVNKEQRSISLGYDFYFFNYHPSTMAWMDTGSLKKIPGHILTMVLEILPDDPFVLCPDTHFHGYCVLDPTIRSSNRKVFAFPRPLESIPITEPYIEKTIPWIGTFGFATKGKGFQHVVEATNKEFEKAVVRINIPFGDFVPQSKEYAAFLHEVCKQKAKPGIEVIVTHDYLTKKELVDWCSQNTLNCFLYDRNLPGLAATTDQAVVSGRPLIVSDNDTFRHILAYLDPYPKMNLKAAIHQSKEKVRRMQEDWSPLVFVSKFEDMLDSLNIREEQAIDKGEFLIPLQKKGVINTLSKRYRKYKRFLSFRKLKYVLAGKSKASNEELI